MLREVPFYDELNTVKESKAFKKQARSYGVEVIDLKDASVQLLTSRSSIKDLFKNLITEKVLLRKHKTFETYNVLLFILILLIKQ